MKDLAGAFARYPRLPKVLNSKVLLDTVLQGVERGLLVARLARPDGSARTWWREWVDPESHGDPQIEVVLPERAELGELPEDLLAPGALPELWGAAGAAFPAGEPRLRIEEPRAAIPERPDAPFVPETGAHEGDPEAQRAPVLTLGGLTDYFRGGHVAHVPREGYDDTFVVPRCPPDALRAGNTPGGRTGGGMAHQRPGFGVEGRDPLRCAGRERLAASSARAPPAARPVGAGAPRRMAGREDERARACPGHFPDAGNGASVGARSRWRDGRRGEPLAPGSRGQRPARLPIRSGGTHTAGTPEQSGGLPHIHSPRCRRDGARRPPDPGPRRPRAPAHGGERGKRSSLSRPGCARRRRPAGSPPPPSTRCSPPGSRRTSRPMLLPPPPPRSPGSPRHGGRPAS